jgi:hypothetical protein
MMDLGESPFDRDEFAVRAGFHIAASQHGGKDVRGRLELQAQNVGKPAFAGFDDGVGMMGDQPAQHGIGVLSVAQVTGAVQGMQAPHGQAGRVADVVQSRGSFQEIGISAENGCQAACPPGDALDVRPAAGQGSCRSVRARCLADEASAFMRPRLDGRRGTFTDVACRSNRARR